MATKEECPYYNNCPFVEFRKSRINPDAKPLPEDGDCGIVFSRCERKWLYDFDDPLPINQSEMHAAFDSDRKSRGCHR